MNKLSNHLQALQGYCFNLKILTDHIKSQIMIKQKFINKNFSSNSINYTNKIAC